MVTVAWLTARSAETTTCSSVGVLLSLVDKVARYCRYEAAGLAMVNGEAVPETAVHADQVPSSGFALLPLRVMNAMLVFAVGRLNVAAKVFQVAPSSW